MADRSKCEGCAQKAACADKDQESLCAMDRMGRIRHKIVVASGKGGVGKSTVSVNLAKALQSRGCTVGLLDADITGPNIPKLLGIEDQKLVKGEGGIVPASAGGIRVVSMALLLSGRDSAVVWRGPMKMGAIKQFISGVNWGDLDFLIIDLPPGTSDEPLSIAQLIPDLSGVVIVTTPQDVALLDSRKAVNMFKGMKVPVVGIVENMSGLACPHCGEMVNIFKTGGGMRMAKEMDVPFLGSVPIDPEIGALGDSGVPFVGRKSRASECFEEVVGHILEGLKTAEKAYLAGD